MSFFGFRSSFEAIWSEYPYNIEVDLGSRLFQHALPPLNSASAFPIHAGCSSHVGDVSLMTFTLLLSVIMMALL